MAFLDSRCIRTVLSPSVLDSCKAFSCGNVDLDAFFLNDAVRYAQQLMGKTYAFVDTLSLKEIVCAFTVSNASIFTNHLPNARKKSIGKHLPWEKRDLIYPAVLIGRLGVNSAYKKRHVGSELLDYIKQWFIDPDNKTGCRYIIVDAYNQPVPRSFYEANGFKYMFSSEQQEREYRNISTVAKLHTRMMYFDLMLLSKEMSSDSAFGHS